MEGLLQHHVGRHRFGREGRPAPPTKHQPTIPARPVVPFRCNPLHFSASKMAGRGNCAVYTGLSQKTTLTIHLYAAIIAL